MKNVAIMVGLFSLYSLKAQVGINTENPQQLFHTDGKISPASTNPATGAPNATQQVDDVVITNQGRLGLGITSPVTKLDINNGTSNGAIKIVDGTQGANRVLTSDANGVGTWKDIGVTSITGTTPNVNYNFGTSADKYMGANITLTKGKWFIYLGLLINGATVANKTYAARYTFSSSETANTIVGFNYINNNRFIFNQTSNGSAGSTTYGMFSSGIVRVEVVSESVTLYLWDVNTRGFGNTESSVFIGNNGENYLFAIRAN